MFRVSWLNFELKTIKPALFNINCRRYDEIKLNENHYIRIKLLLNGEIIIREVKNNTARLVYHNYKMIDYVLHNDKLVYFRDGFEHTINIIIKDEKVCIEFS